MENMKKLIIIVSIVFGPLNGVLAQTINNNLSNELRELNKKSKLSGFAVSIVNADSILYLKSFGYENINAKKKFSTEDRFYIASISKTFIGIGLMKLVEEGKLELSTPINTILPFPVINPYYPESKITIEHLAQHTSSISDGNIESKSWYLDNKLTLSKKAIGKIAYSSFYSWQKNKKTSLGEFLSESLTLQGKLYSKKRFSKSKPGEYYEYSNLGAALAAYIIEIKMGISYDKYIEKFVTTELGFEQGVWRHLPFSKLPTSYFQTKIETPNHIPILYPTGGMLLSCDELSKYLIEMIKGFNGNSIILTPKSFQNMMTSQNGNNSELGIFWELKGDNIGHNGGNYGVTCLMSFDRTTGTGKIFITNISSYNDNSLLKEMIAIWNKLGEYESKFK
ncbi:MAG: hypothetical protein COS19_03790 [Flavobacteriaceae bacterium CG02_land_8_20_14_3_00_34_13]|nr:MAG: hypothetical protein COS19_03790 [Flavobacteriaceae bacterium CG02_land_8_20_14_3_00_34_13]PIZ07123.1 MAG: hypothetical protein COY56_10645 [Flavobacteriaceae bacterium CG_4_10_14_0_8_um_filter_34_31]